MKKNLLCAGTAIVLLSALFAYNANKKNSVSDRVLANLEALTADESTTIGCYNRCFPSPYYDCIITVSVGPSELLSMRCEQFRSGF